MIRWLFILIGIFGLVCVRGFEDVLFYDPFLSYFKLADQAAVFPEFVWGKLILGYLFRFALNTFFSLWIFYFLFQNKEWTKQALALMLLVFVIVFPIYLYCIHDQFRFGYLFSFYVRRFVIQPLTILIIIPIFYYRKNLAKDDLI